MIGFPGVPAKEVLTAHGHNPNPCSNPTGDAIYKAIRRVEELLAPPPPSTDSILGEVSLIPIRVRIRDSLQDYSSQLGSCFGKCAFPYS